MPEGAALPTKIGKYDVKRILATGNMGDVYQAVTQDERTRTPVYHAIKILNPKVARKLPYASRLQSEIKDECLLRYEVDYDSNVQDYFVTDYLDVKPISRNALRRERSSEILDIFARVANAVDKAHRKGYVHGNIKTSNFLIRRAKNDEGKETVFPFLSDFGITYLYNADYFSGPRFSTVLPYMSPERIESLVKGSEKNEGVTAASDVYSLAVVLAEALSGAVPFGDAENLDSLMKAKQEKRYLLLHVNHPIRRVDIKRLNEVVRRGLAPDPGGRFMSIAEFAAALASCRLEIANA